MNLLDRLAFGWGARLPMSLQTEAAECGLACLAMIAGYHGYPSELTELRRRLAVSLKGVNLKNLVSMADRVGFASRPVRLELEELRMLKTPCILHWDLNHFVVLKKAGRDGIVIHDPAVGVRSLPLSVVSRHFTGVALELMPVGEYQEAKPAPRVGIRSLLGRMVGLKRNLAQLFLLALAIEVFSVISPFFLQWVVDHALVTADRDLLLTLALGFTLLLLLKTAVSAMRGWRVIALGASLKVQGRSNLFSHLLRLPAAYFESRHLGDVLTSEIVGQEIVRTLVGSIGLVSAVPITTALAAFVADRSVHREPVPALLYDGDGSASHASARSAKRRASRRRSSMPPEPSARPRTKVLRGPAGRATP